MDEGWIRIYRRIKEHPLWPSSRQYSRLEAWLDLLLSANHKATVVNFDFGMIPVARGQLITSQVKLAKRWCWHRETVSKFLRMLEREEMAVIETSNKTSSGYTLITIQNYEKYQDCNALTTDSETGTQSNTRPTAKRQPSGTNKNEKNEKKKNRRRSADLFLDGFEDFYNPYPRHEDRADAEKAWSEIRPEGELRLQIIRGAEAERARHIARRTEKEFIKLPATYLRKRCWTNQYESPNHSLNGDRPLMPEIGG